MMLREPARRIGLSLAICFFAITLYSPTVRIVTADDPSNRSEFTPLVPLASPHVLKSAETYPNRSFRVEHIVDERELSEYASNNQGTDTFVDFDFGEPVQLAGFRHVDRQDPATVDTAELLFSDDADFSVVKAKETIDHANTPGGTTVAIFATPHTARFVRWRATQLNAQGHGCLGGREVRFFTAAAVESTISRNQFTVHAMPALQRTDDGPVRPIKVNLTHQYAEPVDVTLKVGELDRSHVRLEFGSQSVTLLLPVTGEPRTLPVLLELAGDRVFEQEVELTPVRKWEIYFLPHSHIDIGYTHVQTEVEQKQWQYLRDAIKIAHDTAAYPEAARFKWNCEVLWAVDSYLQKANEEEKAQLIQAVRDGAIHLDGLYGNELTGLCRPEELMRLTDAARRITREHGVKIDAAMISDVPGITWGLVPALAHNGIKYLSIGPNHVHRIGYTLEQWGDRPFYWVSPSGDERLLCWMAGKAYSWFHDSRVGTLSRDSEATPFFDYLEELTAKEYPYDMVQVRYSIGGDNGPPDQELCEFVRAWNQKYVRPTMAIATTSKLMSDFERRYGDQLPQWRGDFTPYWEDGAASSARETSLTRMASERLVQAEALWAMLAPTEFRPTKFSAAWRDAILYNEHTWGAHCSISQPDSAFTQSQWEIKRSFAINADQKSRELLQQALDQRGSPSELVDAVDVFNTCSWDRTDLVILQSDESPVGYIVKDLDGNRVPSERTARGELAFVATDVPPFGARRYLIEPGLPPESGGARADQGALSNGLVRVEIDQQTGSIGSLRWGAETIEFAAGDNASGVNNFLYVAGRVGEAPGSSRVKKIEVLRDRGLTATVAVHMHAPGCRQLITVIGVVDGLNRVDIVNLVDKDKVLSKESVHIGFPFQVPGGVIRLNIPWAVIRPDVDQLPGACKNYFTVGRWADVSNDAFGVTWSTLDAPLLEIGGIHVDVPDPFDCDSWVARLEPTQAIYSYIMNNYWETNYKASQEGLTTFRYSIAPHRKYDQSAAARFGTQCSQPLIAVPANRASPGCRSKLRLEGDQVVVSSLKPSDDRQALMVRLFNASDSPAETRIVWGDPVPSDVTFSSPAEEVGSRVSNSIRLPALGIVTLRAEMPAVRDGNSDQN